MRAIISNESVTRKEPVVPTLMIKKDVFGNHYLLFNNKLLNALNNPTSLQFIVKKDYLYIGEKLPNAGKSYHFNNGVRGNIISDKNLLNLIISTCGLNLSRALPKSSIRFMEKNIKAKLYFSLKFLCKK